MVAYGNQTVYWDVFRPAVLHEQCVYLCRADSTEFKLRTQACVLYCMAQIYTDHGKQAMLVKHVRCNLTRGRGGA